jgi:hypothetical protein
MPPIRQSGNPSLRGWQRAPQTPQKEAQTPPPVAAPTRSALMLAAMPLMASTADAFTRQFYSQSNLPSQRILPAKRGAGS